MPDELVEEVDVLLSELCELLPYSPTSSPKNSPKEASGFSDLSILVNTFTRGSGKVNSSNFLPSFNATTSSSRVKPFPSADEDSLLASLLLVEELLSQGSPGKQVDGKASFPPAVEALEDSLLASLLLVEELLSQDVPGKHPAEGNASSPRTSTLLMPFFSRYANVAANL